MSETQARQGDFLFISIPEAVATDLLRGKDAIARGTRLVLNRSEVTGHEHTVETRGGEVTLYDIQYKGRKQQLMYSSSAPTEHFHPEHRVLDGDQPMTLAGGWTLVLRPYEFRDSQPEAD